MTQRYDLRKNGKAGFEIDEVMNCPVLKNAYDNHYAGVPNADFVSIEVEASSEEEAIEMLLGDFIDMESDLSEFSVMPENRW